MRFRARMAVGLRMSTLVTVGAPVCAATSAYGEHAPFLELKRRPVGAYKPGAGSDKGWHGVVAAGLPAVTDNMQHKEEGL